MHSRFIACAALLALTALKPAVFHLGLRTSEPAKGDTARVTLTEVRLVFTQPVELRYTNIRVVGVRMDTVRGALERPDSTASAVRLRLAQPLFDDDYTVYWRTAGADGHVVTGDFSFVVAGVVAPSAGAVTSPKPADREHASDRQPVPRILDTDPNLHPLSVLTRWLNFGLILLMIGGVAFALLLAARGDTLATEYRQTAGRAAKQMVLVAAALSVLLAVPRLALQSSALHGSDRTWEGPLLMSLLRDTNWGHGWLLQSAGSMLLGFGALAARAPVSAGWKVAAAGSVILAMRPPLAGHAAATEQWRFLTITADALHLFAAGVWLGTLFFVLFIALPIALRQRAYTALATVVRAFSALALVSAAAVVLTGSVSAFAHLVRLADLWTTDYGRLLTLKLLAVGGTAATGFYNWRRVQPVLGSQESTVRLRRSAAVEIAVAVSVLLATAILVALPTP